VSPPVPKQLLLQPVQSPMPQKQKRLQPVQPRMLPLLLLVLVLLPLLLPLAVSVRPGRGWDRSARRASISPQTPSSPSATAAATWSMRRQRACGLSLER
jgi:hypothetical protein